MEKLISPDKNLQLLIDELNHLKINGSPLREQNTDQDDLEILRKEVLNNDSNSIESVVGIQYSSLQRFNALQCLKDNKQLEGIYHLVDSHAHNIRLKAIFRYQLMAKKCTNNESLLFKQKVLAFEKPFTNIAENTKKLLSFVEDMPKEWTVVQVTPRYNPVEDSLYNLKNVPIGPMHVTVFNCGKNQYKPFTVLIDSPRDKVSNKKIEILQNIHLAINDFKQLTVSFSKKSKFKNFEERAAYFNKFDQFKISITNCIKDVQNLWFCEWRCLFIGKYENEKMEKELTNATQNFMKNLNLEEGLREEAECLLYYITKGSHYLNTEEIRKALQYCFRNAPSICLKTVYDFIMTTRDKFNLNTATRNPVILIVDDVWDFIPYEMMDVFSNHLCTRLPSLHFLYMLYKEYESEIVNGYKILKNHNSGSYVVNPDQNLSGMEKRIINFLNYWCPQWSGTSGYPPTSEEFYEYLHSSSIFCYSGHGSGCHIMDVRQLENGWLRSVVFLFGCSSVCVKRDGVHVEAYGTYHAYLIANCPCIVGNLWNVSDKQTDIITSNLFSTWLPSSAEIHWKYVDADAWLHGDNLKFKNPKNEKPIKHEPRLLVALSTAKSDSSSIETTASCVVRGLPVKLEC